MVEIHMTYTSMGVRVEVPNRQMESAILAWAEENMHAPKMGKQQGRITTERGDAFYVHIPSLRTFIFHRMFADRIQALIQRASLEYGVRYNLYQHQVERSEPYRCTFDNPGFAMMETDESSRFFYQNEVVDAACQPDRQQTIFAIQTGRGKTKTCMKVMVKKGVRTLLIHRPTYVSKWLFDTTEDPTGLREDKEGVWVVTGVQAVYEVLEMGENGELDRRGIKIIIIPTVTLQRFLKEYINTAATNPVNLDRFYDTLGVGLLAMDEVHEHFHLVYQAGIMLNPPPSVEMSATLKPGASKAFIAERYLERFPPDLRISIPVIPVVHIRALYYAIEDRKFAFWAGKMTPYNHKLFEGKLIKENLHISYAEMYWDMIEKTYLKEYQVGQKILCIFATVAMCEFFTEFVKDKLAQSEQFHALMVSKFNAGDSYDDFILADISISTPGKAGTAVDKPGLVHMYISTPVEDQQLNEQMAGRPRKIMHKDWGEIDPKVWLFHSHNIPKHCNYLNSRQKSLTDVVLSFKIATSPYVVRKSNAHSAASARANAALCRADLSKFTRNRFKSVSRRRRRR
ncbi:DNA helicase [Erwinia phage phiEaH2]|uniref:Phage putative ATP-dependent DNA helicase n=1 Tax=Erwinia phage phiEaH2 TaxID=1029988 RepID=J7KE81_9CAUD|nr:DNA helicase [Erwinia phage phiEaH2]AFQ96764.1 phage putative ATP-dependent DNA helicase [Erwinia phage phiEaH2]